MKYYLKIFILLFLPGIVFWASPCSAQTNAALNFQSDLSCVPNCSPTVINPYPGLGTDGLGGQSCVSPGRVYSGSPAGSGTVYGTPSYGSGYTTGTPATSAAGLSALPLTSINASDFAEDYSSPLIPAEGAELYLSRMPVENRSGFFQKGNVNALWTPKSGSEAVGMTQFDASLSFAVPFFKQDSPLIITPLFQAWILDPKSDVEDFFWRDKYYTTGVDFRWLKPIIRNKLTLDLGAAPLYSGTFHGKAKKAMRYPAHVATIWTCNPRLQFVVGVAYLDRNDDYNWMPMAGIIWKPSDDLSFELVTPRLRISQRIRWFGCGAGENKSDWLYAGFEIAGGSWSETRDDTKLELDYRDFRALLGYERRTAFGVTLGFEVGYMFKRRYEYSQPFSAKLEPKDNVFLRVRTTF